MVQSQQVSSLFMDVLHQDYQLIITLMIDQYIYPKSDLPLNKMREISILKKVQC